MSAEAISYVLKHSKAPPIPRLVLVSIAHHADESGANSAVSISGIMAETGVSKDHIRKCLRALEKLGELSTAANASTTFSNVYTIAGMRGEVSGMGVARRAVRGPYRTKEERAWPVTRPLSVREMKSRELRSELRVGGGPRP